MTAVRTINPATGLACMTARLYARNALIPDSSAVEQPAVNRLVAGSNPAPGANALLPPLDFPHEALTVLEEKNVRVTEMGNTDGNIGFSAR